MSDANRQLPPLALRPREAAMVLGISPRLLWQLTRDGKVPHVRLGHGKRAPVLYPMAGLSNWLIEQISIAGNGWRKEVAR